MATHQCAPNSTYSHSCMHALSTDPIVPMERGERTTDATATVSKSAHSVLPTVARRVRAGPSPTALRKDRIWETGGDSVKVCNM